MAGAVLLSGLVGLLGAWGAQVSLSGGRKSRLVARFFFLAMIAALAMPMILHATAWEAAAGKFGWMSMTQTGARSYEGLAGEYGGMVACVWVHGMFGAALVSLAILTGIRKIPTTISQQARLDLSPAKRWWSVELPIAAPWWIMALLATAALAASEMTVVDLYGVRTLADRFYLEFATEPDLLAITQTLVLPIAFSVAAIVIVLVGRQKRFDIQSRVGQVDQSDEQTDFAEIESRSKLARVSAPAALIVCVMLVALVPLASLIVKVGHEVKVTEDAGGESIAEISWSAAACAERLSMAPADFATEYQWTAIIAIGMGLWSLMIAWPIAAKTRCGGLWQKFFDGIFMIAFLVPGPIVGLAVVRLFAIDVIGFRTLYQETLIPTFVALSFRAVPVMYWGLRTGYQGISRHVMDSAELDFSSPRRIWEIDFPMLKRSILVGFLAVAVVATGDVPATLPVVPPGVTTVGTRLFALLHSGARYQEAALAVWYVLAVVLIAGVLSRQAIRKA